MKPFNLELAKRGEPVCTRNGKPARIICFDAKDDVYSIVALINNNGVEETCWYDEDGLFYPKEDTIHDLMMVGEKHTGWINICKDEHVYAGITIWDTEREAREHIKTYPKYITTIKIEWEE